MSGFDALMTGLAYSRGREADDAWSVARHNAAIANEWIDYARGLEQQIAELNQQVEHLRHELAASNQVTEAWRVRSANKAGGARALAHLIERNTGQSIDEFAGSTEELERLAEKYAAEDLANNQEL